MPSTVLCCLRNVFTKPLCSNDKGYTDRLCFYKTQTTENSACTISSIVVCICCDRNVFTEPLPGIDGGGGGIR
jgi:hypothetical protein